MNDFPIVFALYPRITQLDFTGPFEVFARLPGARCILASVEGGTVVADGGIRFAGVVRLADIPSCALLCVPGGFGTIATLENAEYLREIARLGSTARYVTSVCTGSLLLAAAGLLQGRRAGCHWAWRDLLPLFGASPCEDRVVVDRNRITGGGVTAGIDFAFHVVEAVRGLAEAEMVRLALEYDPQPIGLGGTPSTARSTVLQAVRRRYDALGLAARREAISRLAASAGSSAG